MPTLILTLDAVLALSSSCVATGIIPARRGPIFDPGEQACGILIDENIIMNERRVIQHGGKLIVCAGAQAENVARGLGTLGSLL